MNIIEPIPVIKHLIGAFQPQKGKVTLDVTRLKTTTERIEVSALESMPDDFANKVLNFFGFRQWVPLTIKEDKVEKVYWVSVEELADKLQCSEKSIRKAAKVAKTAGVQGELETWITVASTYEQLKRHFSPVLRPDQMRFIVKTLEAIGSELATAKTLNTELERDARTKAILDRHFKHLPITIMSTNEGTSLSLLGTANEEAGKLGAGVFKTVCKVVKVETGKTYALAAARMDSELRIREARDSLEVESSLLMQLKGSKGVLPIDHVVTYTNAKGEMAKGMILHLCNKGSLGKLIFNEAKYDNSDEGFIDHLDIWEDILEGIKYSHEKGIINNDLKPDNILLETYKYKEKTRLKAYVSDFGLAYKPLRNEQDVCSDIWNERGTPIYWAPEMIDHFINRNNPFLREIGKPADLFAAGCIIYELLYKKDPPWFNVGTNRGHDVKNFFNTKLENFLKELKTDSPFGEILAKMLNPNPEKRITAKDALELLQKVRAEKGYSPRPPR